MNSLFAQAAAGSTPSSAPDFWHSGALGYMFDGGLFMWPILLLAIYGIAVVIERFRTLWSISLDPTGLRSNVTGLVRNGKVDEAILLCEQSRGPAAAILSVGLRRYDLLRNRGYDREFIIEQVDKSMADYSNQIAAALEKHLSALALIANVAPMLGSVGTVVGMVVLFKGIVEKFGSENILLTAADGIKLKLIVTIFGLIVAIPAYMFHNYFSNRVNRFLLEAEESAAALSETLLGAMAVETIGLAKASVGR